MSVVARHRDVEGVPAGSVPLADERIKANRSKGRACARWVRVAVRFVRCAHVSSPPLRRPRFSPPPALPWQPAHATSRQAVRSRPHCNYLTPDGFSPRRYMALPRRSWGVSVGNDDLTWCVSMTRAAPLARRGTGMGNTVMRQGALDMRTRRRVAVHSSPSPLQALLPDSSFVALSAVHYH